jgi:hypothetical protein
MPKIKKKTKADMSAATADTVAMKKYRNQTVFTVITVPKKSKSKKKQDSIDAFRDANTWAKNKLKEPGMKELYSKGINSKLSNAHTVAVCDKLHPPVIHYINVEKFRGAVGDEIRVKATDDFQVTEVELSIMNGNGKIIEKGAAVPYGRNHSIWIYTVKVTNPSPVGTVITATAYDRPGNRAVKKVTIGESVISNR